MALNNEMKGKDQGSGDSLVTVAREIVSFKDARHAEKVFLFFVSMSVWEELDPHSRCRLLNSSLC